MKILLFIILFIPAIGASAQTDTLVMNDGHIVPCQITASNYNFLSVMIDSTNYIVEKKFLKRFTLYSNTQPSLVVKNMDY